MSHTLFMWNMFSDVWFLWFHMSPSVAASPNLVLPKEYFSRSLGSYCSEMISVNNDANVSMPWILPWSSFILLALKLLQPLTTEAQSGGLTGPNCVGLTIHCLKPLVLCSESQPKISHCFCRVMDKPSCEISPPKQRLKLQIFGMTLTWTETTGTWTQPLGKRSEIG